MSGPKNSILGEWGISLFKPHTYFTAADLGESIFFRFLKSLISTKMDILSLLLMAEVLTWIL